ncbi:hypothetical protein CHUUTOTORO_02790 [Serratia phage vB_SmaM-ChuuTotoro]|nr:hypothetical protein CHUUTOTORO_02790 [Serratia phage vB_SmaM-ChuuTotoro]
MAVLAALMVMSGMFWAAREEPKKVDLPPIFPAEIERLAEVCTKNGAYSSYLIISESQPRKVMCKFERRVKSTDSLGGQHWNREVYTYDAKQLEKEKV